MADSKPRLRPMRGLKTDRTARVIVPGHTFMQNLRRGHYELGVEARAHRRVTAAIHRTRPSHLSPAWPPARASLAEPSVNATEPRVLGVVEERDELVITIETTATVT